MLFKATLSTGKQSSSQTYKRTLYRTIIPSTPVLLVLSRKSTWGPELAFELHDIAFGKRKDDYPFCPPTFIWQLLGRC